MAAPDDFTGDATAILGMNKSDTAAKREVGANDGHAAGATDVHGHAIGATAKVALLPFDQEADAGDGTFVGAEARPTFFEFGIEGESVIQGRRGHRYTSRKI